MHDKKKAHTIIAKINAGGLPEPDKNMYENSTANITLNIERVKIDLLKQK